MSKCVGCGVTLQNIDKNELGYTLDLSNKYCERCFKIMHYNEEKKIKNLDNNKIIDKINKMNCFTFFITDLINLSSSVINEFKKIKNEKVLLINKCDIIPNNLKLEHLEENIKNSYNICDDVFFISAKKKYNLNKVIDLIEEKKCVLFCGETSSGKSTLINNLIGSSLTTSKYDNTTIEFIKLKYLDYCIYDTPGINFNNKKEVADKIIINTKVLNNDYILTIGNIKIKGNGNITIIRSDKCNIYTKKEDIILNEKIEIKENSDVIIPGIGFIYIKNKMTLESNVKLEVRDSIIGR